MLLTMLLMFLIGWFSNTGDWGLVVVFSLLELVELYRRGQQILKAQQRDRVNRLTGR